MQEYAGGMQEYAGGMQEYAGGMQEHYRSYYTFRIINSRVVEI